MFSVEQHGSTPVVHLTRGADRVEVPALWLRERSRLPSQLDLVSEQRLFDPHRLDADLSIVDARADEGSLWVRFSDGHDESFALDALTESVDPDDGCPAAQPWDATLGRPPLHDWRAVGHDDDALLHALRDFIRFGVIVVHDAPTDAETVLAIAQRFGYVRQTNFGRMFDVQSVPNSNDLAYRTIGLGPHTDNPYRVPVPGIQLLHCMVNETTGGLSTLVDAVAVTDQLRREDPAGFQLLAGTVVRFRFRDDDTELISQRPIVAIDHLGRVTGLHYSPRMDFLPMMSAADTRAYQRARSRLAQLLNDPSFEIRFRLEPGQAMIFSNDRILHGRTEFDLNEGHRHLQGCYIDHDAPLSRFRVLSRTAVRTET
ncbi:MAG: gamma-butyrobetaine,2-oxoglutarate dioxygenase [Ilumatobacteraceae bacterium]|nr:gamma-butyrobetaine,2-oxoglutarate dioxygenase [Ilumatobacteraceae bacterium]